MNDKKAIVLLSGGLDSAVTLHIAKKEGYQAHCLIFDYGQRHSKEIECAKTIARSAGSEHKLLKVSLPWKGSSLLDEKIKIPRRTKKIPNTYVAARNMIFLTFGLSFAEAIGARAVYIGAHAQDYSGYPDCRPEFYRAFRRAASRGTRAGVERRPIQIKTPLLNKTKAQIINSGVKLGVPLELTWSCYRGGNRPCGRCESCFYRAKGFKEAWVTDPLLKR